MNNTYNVFVLRRIFFSFFFFLGAGGCVGGILSSLQLKQFKKIKGIKSAMLLMKILSKGAQQTFSKV